MLNKQYYVEKAKVDRLVARKNTKESSLRFTGDMIWMRRRIRTLWSVSASTL